MLDIVCTAAYSVTMENINFVNWNPEKDNILKQARDVSFEDVLSIINSNKVLDVYNHPNTEKYPNQQIMVVVIRDYVYIVPFIFETEKSIFLKTIIPSRKATKIYFGDHHEK